MPNPATLIADGVRVLTEPETPRETWLTLRRAGLGGSDALAVAGLDPFKSPLGVWLEKVDHPDAPQIEETPMMRWGHILEQPLADWFTDQTGIAVHRCGMLGHPTIAWQLYTPDRLAEDDAIVEFKTTNPWNVDEWADGQVSDRAEIQVQHGFSVTGKKRAYVVVGIWGQEPQLRVVDRNDDLIHDLSKIENDFWALVTSATPPAFSGHPTDGSLLARMYPQADPSASVELSPHAYEALATYKQLTAKMDEMGTARDELRAIITAEMGGSSVGTWMDRPVVSWRNTGPLNEGRLREAHPDLAERFTVRRRTIDSKALLAANPELASFRSRRFLPASKI